MKLIIGLGNPGKKYQFTRHNVGFMVIDQLAKKLKLKFHTSQHSHAAYTWVGDSAELVKPQTQMNRSGITVASIVKKHGLAPSDIMVVADDIDMEPGKLRRRNQGSGGGHNGLQSIIDYLGTTEFPRLKIGIGRPPCGIEPSVYVLQSFTPSQLTIIKFAIQEAVDLLLKEM